MLSLSLKSLFMRSFHSSLKSKSFSDDKLQLRVNFKYPLPANQRKNREKTVDKFTRNDAKDILVTESGRSSTDNNSSRTAVSHSNKTNLKSTSEGWASKWNHREMRDNANCAFLSEDLMEMEKETAFRPPMKPKWKKAAVKASEHSKINGEILFGINPVKNALRVKRRRFHRLFVKTDLTIRANERITEVEVMARELGIPVDEVSVHTLDRLSEGRPHQGVCLDVGRLHMKSLPVESYQHTASHCEASESMNILWILMDKLQDPMNVGAVLRSSYYFGADRVLAVRNEMCKLTPVVSKASSGAMEILSVYEVQNPVQLLNEMVNSGWCVIGSAASHSLNHDAVSQEKIVSDLRTFSWPKWTILLIGNEGDGIRSELLHLCSKIIILPSRRELDPNMQSLNVSVATGIILSSFCMHNRQRETIKK